MVRSLPFRRLRRLQLRLLRWLGRPILCRHRGHLIEIDPRDEFIAAELLVDGTWEEPLFRELERIDLRGRVAIDVGAHVGVHSLALSDFVGKEGRVIALEPEPVNFDRLRRNLERNGSTNVQALQAAAGRAAGTAWLRTASPNFGAHRVVADDTGLSTNVVALDSLADPRQVGFVKIDAEGCEHEILAGMSRVLISSLDLVLHVEVEVHTPQQVDRAAALIADLEDSGFRTTLLDHARSAPTRKLIEELGARFGVINLFASRRR